MMFIASIIKIMIYKLLAGWYAYFLRVVFLHSLVGVFFVSLFFCDRSRIMLVC